MPDDPAEFAYFFLIGRRQNRSGDSLRPLNMPVGHCAGRSLICFLALSHSTLVILRRTEVDRSQCSRAFYQFSTGSDAPRTGRRRLAQYFLARKWSFLLYLERFRRRPSGPGCGPVPADHATARRPPVKLADQWCLVSTPSSLRVPPDGLPSADGQVGWSVGAVVDRRHGATSGPGRRSRLEHRHPPASTGDGRHRSRDPKAVPRPLRQGKPDTCGIASARAVAPPTTTEALQLYRDATPS